MTTPSTHGRELISFRVGGQDFCIDIMAVREIRGWTAATPLPHAPSYVRGVVNLRGAVLPIIDLAARLGLKTDEPTSQHVIIIAQIGEQAVGMLVDAVSDILTVTADMIQPTPDIASGIVRTYVEGLITRGTSMLSLLQLGQLIPDGERMAA